jgi:hypothetical protein
VLAHYPVVLNGSAGRVEASVTADASHFEEPMLSALRCRLVR